MGFFFKKKKTAGRSLRQNDSNRASASVMRYYRPDSTGRKRTTQTNSTAERPRGEDTSGSGRLSKFIDILVRWGLLATIGIVFFSNFGLVDTRIQIKLPEKWPYDAEYYKEGARAIQNSSVLYRTKLTLRSDRFEEQFKGRFPEVQEVTVTYPIAGRQLIVNVILSEPLLRIVGAGNQQGIVTQDGLVSLLDESQKINESFSYLPSLSVVDLPIELGQRVLTSEEAELLSLLVSELDGSEAYRPKISSVEFDVKKREIIVKFVDKNYFGKLTPESESRGQVGSLVAVIRDSVEKGTPVGSYIDVRVEGRVFVK
jgi:hypothetical protein